MCEVLDESKVYEDLASLDAILAKNSKKDELANKSMFAGKRKK